jgi:predicted PurR-regulated permease PerM
MPRGVILLLGLAAVVVAVAGIRVMAWLIGPAFLALILVIAVSPVQGWLRRHGLPRWAATLALVLAVYLLLVGMLLVVIVSVAQLANQLPQYADQAKELLRSATAVLKRFGVDQQQVHAIAGSLDLGKLAAVAGSVLSGVAGLATNLVFLLALLLFLSVEAGDSDARLAAIGRDRPDIARVLCGFATGTRKYLVVTAVFGLIVAVLDYIALVIIGVPLALTWGFLSFITNFIPNIGFVLGLVPPAILALLDGGSGRMVAVIVIYVVLNLVVQSIIQPRFVGDSVGLSVTVTFLSLVFWAWILGPLGAILAIPMTLLAKALLVDTDPRAGWADALLRDRPARPAEPVAEESERAAPLLGSTTTPA